MFTPNNTKEKEIETNNNQNLIDPLTIWLIRISSILIIIFFTGIIIGLPLINCPDKISITKYHPKFKRFIKSIYRNLFKLEKKTFITYKVKLFIFFRKNSLLIKETLLGNINFI